MDKKKQPLISVIIPTYNESATIQGTLKHLSLEEPDRNHYRGRKY